MSKKSGGLFTLVTGMIMGATAVFLSKQENRDLAKKEAKKAVAKVKKVKAEIKKDPQAFAKKIEKKGKKMVKTAKTSVSKKLANNKSVKKVVSAKKAPAKKKSS